MADRKKIALLVGQADEYYQSQFIEGFTGKAFECDMDVVVFASYLKYQNSRVREIGETSIFSLVPYEEFDAIAVMYHNILPVSSIHHSKWQSFFHPV